jgi:hypothetical protein
LWLPLLVVLLVTLLPRQMGAAGLRFFAIVLFGLALRAAESQFARSTLAIAKMSPQVVAQRRFYDELAKVLLSSPTATPYGLFFDECTDLLWCQAFFDHGQSLPPPSWSATVHDSYYQLSQPNFDARQVTTGILHGMEQGQGTRAVVLCAPAGLDKLEELQEVQGKMPFSRAVLSGVSDHIRQSSNWRLIKQIEHPVLGPVGVFEYAPQFPTGSSPGHEATE